MPFVAFLFFIVNLLNNPLNLYSMKKILLSFLLLFTSITFAFSQNNVVTGKVTDQKDGSSLPGVTVSVKGSPTIGVQTDVNGKYSLSVPATAKTLVFKYIGFKELEIAITGSVLNVVMETDSKQLTEVLVVGYGTQKRQNVTGSISSISAKEIESTPVTSLEQAIQGKSAGVFVQADNGKLGQGIQIRVRGSSSVSAGTQPLYILDGIPITTDNLSSTSAATNPIADINFNDIESIQILKDASASAIYGARASNGVVVITTKKGKMGATKINFTAQYGNSKPSRHRKFLNAQQFVDYTKRAKALVLQNKMQQQVFTATRQIRNRWLTHWPIMNRLLKATLPITRQTAKAGKQAQ
jgi:TonB-dependent SusC/RagA subfamily outer membrane receptor